MTELTVTNTLRSFLNRGDHRVQPSIFNQRVRSSDMLCATLLHTSHILYLFRKLVLSLTGPLTQSFGLNTPYAVTAVYGARAHMGAGLHNRLDTELHLRTSLGLLSPVRMSRPFELEDFALHRTPQQVPND